MNQFQQFVCLLLVGIFSLIVVRYVIGIGLWTVMRIIEFWKWAVVIAILAAFCAAAIKYAPAQVEATLDSLYDWGAHYINITKQEFSKPETQSPSEEKTDQPIGLFRLFV